MSEVAVELVKQLAKKKTGPDGKPFSSAELRVLKVLAWKHNEFVWCAWPKLRELAAEAVMSESHARKTITGLIERGVLRRYFATSERWQEQTSNEYEFCGLEQYEIPQSTRDIIFKYKRFRSAVQIPLRRGGKKKRVTASDGAEAVQDQRADEPTGGPAAEQDAPAGLMAVEESVDVIAGGNGCSGKKKRVTASDGAEAVQDQRADEPTGGPAAEQDAPAGLMAVEESVDVIAGGNGCSCGGQSLPLPVELDLELHGEDITPFPPSVAAQGCASPSPSSDARFGHAQSRQKPKATASASARATATTSSTEAAMASMERGGEASLSLGARPKVVEIGAGRRPGVRPVRQPRDVDAARAQLDGEDLALFDEAVRVLMACGVAPECSTRSQRKAVAAQLRMYANGKDCSIADAGLKAVDMWRLYVESGPMLAKFVGVQKFFASGYWLNSGVWDWCIEAREKQRRFL